MVRCLDGGAWDRSSNYGLAPDLPTARRLAAEKLAASQEMRAQPHVYWDDVPLVMRARVRPGEGTQVLYRATDPADVARWILEHTSCAGQAGQPVSDEAE
jgi:hypothetical protein